ncbi:50S ribosomal protein L18 [Nonlabens arenilitoris]|uniref:Large ribosomal subunit protein uL18 n=1 Tax=Nonlabens arenilitoris TaxID=1217969 RepID=A0A2S7U738_9FLAO|nr:50S ribosomal protein L18 [Nonlabens arenilitoris]PQJ30805.1 50S ribosomal protein L18 [Nonlabens arenilitoris]
MAFSKSERRNKIRRRIRKNISGTAERPRLSVYRSNKEIYAQVINDVDGVTIASASSRDLKSKGEKISVANEVGKAVAEKAKAAGVETVSFDRGGYLYHGRVLSLANGAREAGLKF